MPAGGILDRQARLARSGQARRRGRAARCRLPTQRLAMTCVVDHEAVSDPVVQVSRDSPPPPVHEALAPRQCVILPPACLAAGGKGVSRISGRASESHVFARRTSTHRLPTSRVPGGPAAALQRSHRGTALLYSALLDAHCTAHLQPPLPRPPPRPSSPRVVPRLASVLRTPMVACRGWCGNF